VSSIPELKRKAATGSAPAPSSHSSNSAPDLLRGEGNSSKEAFKKPNLKELPYSVLLSNVFQTETVLGKKPVLLSRIYFFRFWFGSSSTEPQIRIAAPVSAPAPDSFIRYLDNYLF
jgi:hypothetical protein